jgi:hypothetical protein
MNNKEKNLFFDGTIGGGAAVPSEFINPQVDASGVFEVNNETERTIYRLFALHPELRRNFGRESVPYLNLAEQREMLRLMQASIGIKPLTDSGAQANADGVGQDDSADPDNTAGAEETLCPECSGLGQTGHALAGWKQCFYCDGIGWV